MTLPLRRKRPTTQPNTLRRKGKRTEQLLAALVAGAALLCGGTLDAAEFSSGAKLQWKPVRPSVKHAGKIPARSASSAVRRVAGETYEVEGPAKPPSFSLDAPGAEHVDPFEANGGEEVGQTAGAGHEELPLPEAVDSTPSNAAAPAQVPATSPRAPQFKSTLKQQPSRVLQRGPYAAPTSRQSGVDRTPTPPRTLAPPSAAETAQSESGELDCEKGVAMTRATRIDSVELLLTSVGQTPPECDLPDDLFMDRCWAPNTYSYKASALCHKPLYFEDEQLERYGHEWGPFLQPPVSAAHFFTDMIILPYRMGLQTPNECVYALGHYRPGSCAPYMFNPIGWTWRAGLFQAGAVVGAAYVLP